MKKIWFNLILVLFLVFGITTSGFAKTDTTSQHERKVVEIITYSDEELFELIEQANVVDAAELELFRQEIANAEISMENYEGVNYFYKYDDGSFELGLSAGTLRWIAIIAVAAVVGVLAAIPGVGWSVASAVAGVILGYAVSSLITSGIKFHFEIQGRNFNLKSAKVQTE